MYATFSVILFTGLCFLTFLHLRTKPVGKWLTVTEGVLMGVGILLHPLVLVLLRGQLSSFDTTYAAWAWDAMTTYLKYALVLLAIFFGLTFLCALTALGEKKYRTSLHIRLRSLASLAATVVLLALAGFFAAMSATESLPLDTLIHVLGGAGALTLRGMYLAESLWQRKYPPSRRM